VKHVHNKHGDDSGFQETQKKVAEKLMRRNYANDKNKITMPPGYRRQSSLGGSYKKPSGRPGMRGEYVDLDAVKPQPQGQGQGQGPARAAPARSTAALIDYADL
jgi:hypothetical protein